jgi:hypothetical protein
VPFIHSRVIDDPWLGVLTVVTDSDAGRIWVTGPDVPEVDLHRVPGTRSSELIPIGTRRAEDLVLTVGGVSARIRPGPGRLTRRSHDIEVDIGAVRYRARNGPYSSTLLRDGRDIGELYLHRVGGDLTAVVDWSEDVDTVTPDAVIGYVLAIAFGAGADHAAAVLVRTVMGIFS